MAMDGLIEALHIYDEHNAPILSHTYTSRPIPADQLLPQYLKHGSASQPLLYLPNANPPTLVFSLRHGNLLFLLTASSEVEPLLVLEFLHRVADALEEFLGAPLTASRLEASYDVAAQLLTEMCDAGTVATTEPNALRDLVEVEGALNKLLGGLAGNLKIGPGPGGGSGLVGGGSSSSSSMMLAAQGAPAVLWRRAVVRHTSNEMYADVVEALCVTLAPSGRPLAARASGTVAFTCKVSGVPDVVLSLAGPSGRHGLGGLIELPVFHPCVRLNRWKERPGELSFVPPDGRFVLAGYEVDLLPFTDGQNGGLNANSLKLPVNIEVKTGLGPVGADFEVKVQVSKMFGAPISAPNSFGRGGGPSGRAFGAPHAGTPGAPSLEDLKITVPLPTDVRNLSEIRPSKGDAIYNPGDRFLEWSISAKDLATGSTNFGLRCTVMGQVVGGEDEEAADPSGFGFQEYSYDEPYQSTSAAVVEKTSESSSDDKEAKKVAQNKILMPTSASVSFQVKGWLPSGIKVESIQLDPKRSRGLGEGVKPYKGVKYLTVSKDGVEIRC